MSEYGDMLLVLLTEWLDTLTCVAAEDTAASAETQLNGKRTTDQA
jgi:hypothetical protein